MAKHPADHHQKPKHREAEAEEAERQAPEGAHDDTAQPEQQPRPSRTDMPPEQSGLDQYPQKPDE